MGIEQILWLILIGIGIATFYVYFIRRFVGTFVRKLIEIDAGTPDTAVTLQELHMKMTLPLKMALRQNGSLDGAVLRVGKEGETRYYIAPEKVDMLKFKYRKENLPLLFLLIVLFAIIAVGLILDYTFPKLQELFNALFESA